MKREIERRIAALENHEDQTVTLFAWGETSASELIARYRRTNPTDMRPDSAFRVMVFNWQKSNLENSGDRHAQH